LSKISFWLQRIAQLLIVLLLVTFGVSLLLRLIPVDLATVLLPVGTEEERDIEYANTPDEEYEDVSVQTQGGDGEVAGMEKDMHRGGSARFSDNPMAAESIEMPKKISKMLEGIKKVDKEV